MCFSTPDAIPAPPAVSNALAPAAAPVPQISQDEPTTTNTSAMSLTTPTPTPAPPATTAPYATNAENIADQAHVTLLSTLKEIAQGSNQLADVHDMVRRTGASSIRQVLEMAKAYKTPQDMKLVSPPCTQQSCWNALNLLVALLRTRVLDDMYCGADVTTVGPVGIFLAEWGILEAYKFLVAAGADSMWLLSTVSSAKKMALLLGPDAPVSLVETLWRGILSHRRTQRREVLQIIDPDATDSDEEALSDKGKKRSRSDTDTDTDVAASQPHKRPALCLSACE